MTRIAPGPDTDATATRDDTDSSSAPAMTYVLVPSHELPDLDLSISIKSRFFSTRVSQWIDRSFKRYRTLIVLAYVVSSLGYPVFLVLELQSSRYVSIAVAILGLPAALVGPCFLRYHVVKELLQSTYDVWFFTIINTVTFSACAITLGDIRCLTLLSPWLGVELNIFVDANIRASRRITLLTIVAAAMLILAIPIMAMGWVHGLRNVMLWEYNTHSLPASTVAFNGVTTVVALLVRNIVRYRATLHRTRKLSASNPNEASATVSCVAYRCTLRFVPIGREGDSNSHASATPPPPAAAASSRPPYMQRMQYQSTFSPIDATATIISYQLLVRIDTLVNTARLQWLLLRLSVFMTLFAMPLDYFVAMQRQSNGESTDAFPIFHVIAFIFTGFFGAFTFVHYQRQLLRAILTSFNFCFVTVQLVIVHVAICDFFHWNERTATLATVSLCWNVWIMCVDALTPRTREMLGISVHVVAHITGVCIGSSVLVLYLMIFSDYSNNIFDRVLFSKRFFTYVFEFRVSPMFYSCFVTILGSAVRFFWRVCTSGPHDLVVIDGPVVYRNYLRRGDKRQSMPWLTGVHSCPSTGGRAMEETRSVEPVNGPPALKMTGN